MWVPPILIMGRLFFLRRQTGSLRLILSKMSGRLVILILCFTRTKLLIVLNPVVMIVMVFFVMLLFVIKIFRLWVVFRKIWLV